jgi:SAM-dependent methyltransferase
MSEEATGAFKKTYAELYDRYLVPMMFAPYARVLAERARTFAPRSVLETAAGTGILTQELTQTLPSSVPITATDLNLPMIERAATRPSRANVTWRQADALNLPFPDDSFSLVICQFGVMFFLDKQASFREAWRVLEQGGGFLFAVWDDWNDMVNAPLAIAAEIVGVLLGCHPSSLVSPPYHHENTIRAHLGAAGFQSTDIQRITRPATAASAREGAVATVHGSLIRTAIESAAPGRLDEATDAVERAFRAKFGDGPLAGAVNALIVATEKPRA